MVALFLLIAGIKALQICTMISAGKKMVPPPTTVTSAEVKEERLGSRCLTAVGSISPVQGAMIQRGARRHRGRDQFSIGGAGEEGRCCC